MFNDKYRMIIKSEIYKCTRCGKCKYSCPTFNVVHWETYSPRGRLIIIDNYITDKKVTHSFIDRVYSCSLCKICEEICSSHINVHNLMEIVRNELVNLGEAPYKGHLDMLNDILESGNIFNKQKISESLQSLIDESPEHSDILFYMGCTGSHQYPELAINWIKILQKAGFNFTIQRNEVCCSGILKMIGMIDRFKEIALKNTNIFEKSGAQTIITACPMCFSILKNDYTDILGDDVFNFEVVNIYDLIDKAIKKRKIELFKEIPIKISYHDPCHLGRWSNIYDAPRNIINSIPKLTLSEMDKIKEESKCCGGPIRVPFFKIRDGMSENVINSANEVGANALVTACPTCYHNLRATGWIAGIQVYEISELVAYSAGLLNRLQGLQEITDLS